MATLAMPFPRIERQAAGARRAAPPGLELDIYDGYGFVAVAMVETRELRPAFLPRLLGQDFFLAG